MRLIDADALGVGRCSRDVLPAEYCAGWNGLIHLIETAPTIDPESLRPKGKWYWLAYDANLKIGNWHCTRCNRTPKSHQKEDFCPNCGADMRQEAKEDGRC